MKFKYFNIFALFLGFWLPLQAQQPNDVKVVVHEETLNKIFAALGDVSGINDYEVLLIKGKYKWTMQNPRIILKPVKSGFVCEAIVNVGSFDYKAPVAGDLSISYDPKSNQIQVKLIKAIFEIYTKVLGKKIHIKDIDLADYLNEPFTFEGPQTLGTEMEFEMPDHTKRKVYLQPSLCSMIVIDKQIITTCEMAVDNKPIKITPQVLQSTAINENKVTISNEPPKEEPKKKKRKRKKEKAESSQ
jgi:hypothetical protein